MVRNLPAMRETQVQSLSWEDSLQEGMVTHSGVLAWRIPTDRSAWWAIVHGVTNSRTQLSDSVQAPNPFHPLPYLGIHMFVCDLSLDAFLFTEFVHEITEGEARDRDMVIC